MVKIIFNTFLKLRFVSGNNFQYFYTFSDQDSFASWLDKNIYVTIHTKKCKTKQT